MDRRYLLLPALALFAALLMAGCGGGGGEGTGPVSSVAITAIEVTTQPVGPESPFASTLGGDTIVVHGSGFQLGLTVQVGGTSASVSLVTSSNVTLTAPAHAEGVVTVTVRNPNGGEASALAGLQYFAPPLVLAVEALSGPTEGENRAPIAGGTPLEIRGRGFREGMQVTVAGRSVATTVFDAFRAQVNAPATQAGGPVQITVVNPEGMGGSLPAGLVYTQEFSLDQQPNFLDNARASHLFRRAGFGATPTVIEAAANDGLGPTVDALLDYANDSDVEAAALALYGANPPPAPNLNTRTNKEWWIHLMLENPNPFQERLAFFLHDHFATSEREFAADARWFLNSQINTLRRFSMSSGDSLPDGSPGLDYNWQKLLAEICKDRAILEWLDGRVSYKGKPNENFARELWELFMLGEGVGYTEEDIQGAARAFTGFFWYYSGGRGVDSPLEMRYRPARHDELEKTIFGETGNFGYDTLSPFYETSTGGNDPANGTTDPDIDTDPRDTDGGIVALTLRKRPIEASLFICRKLAAFFLYEDPDEELIVKPLALQLRTSGANQWNLKPILRRLLLSKAMFSERAMKGKVKGPVEYVVGFLRTTDIDLNPNPATNASQTRQRMIEIGQVVLDPPDVNGWPTGNSWLSSQAMLERFNFLNYVVARMTTTGFDFDSVLPPAGQRSPAQLVDHISGVLDVQLTGNARAKCIDYVNSEMVGDQIVPLAFDPENATHLEMKVRGLFYMIGQYYDSHRD